MKRILLAMAAGIILPSLAWAADAQSQSSNNKTMAVGLKLAAMR